MGRASTWMHTLGLGLTAGLAAVCSHATNLSCIYYPKPSGRILVVPACHLLLYYLILINLT